MRGPRARVRHGNPADLMTVPRWCLCLYCVQSDYLRARSQVRAFVVVYVSLVARRGDVTSHSRGQRGWRGERGREGRSPRHPDSPRHGAAPQPGLPAEPPPPTPGGRPRAGGPANLWARGEERGCSLPAAGGGGGEQKGNTPPPPPPELCFSPSPEGRETSAPPPCRSCSERGGQSGCLGPWRAAGPQDV